MVSEIRILESFLAWGRYPVKVHKVLLNRLHPAVLTCPNRWELAPDKGQEKYLIMLMFPEEIAKETITQKSIQVSKLCHHENG